MRAERPIYHLARQLQQSQPLSKLKRGGDDMLLVAGTDDPPIVIFLPLECPTGRQVGQYFMRHSKHHIAALLALPGDLLFEDTTPLQETLAVLEIFYPQKIYAYKVLDGELSILPAFMNMMDDQLHFHFGMPVDFAHITLREVEVNRITFYVADFGTRPVYDPQAKLRQWQAKYGSGNGGRRTHQRRRPRAPRRYAAAHYYEVLGVQRTATMEDIKQAYRQLARELHPDVNPSPEAKVRMQKINEAYAALVKANYILRK